MAPRSPTPFLAASVTRWLSFGCCWAAYNQKWKLKQREWKNEKKEGKTREEETQFVSKSNDFGLKGSMLWFGIKKETISEIGGKYCSKGSEKGCWEMRTKWEVKRRGRSGRKAALNVNLFKAIQTKKKVSFIAPSSHDFFFSFGSNFLQIPFIWLEKSLDNFFWHQRGKKRKARPGPLE